MIGFLEGKVISKNDSTLRCVILVNQIGYELTVSKGLFDSVGADESVSLWVETIAKENGVTLYGFSSQQDKKFFKLLIGVSGLGPKTALSLINEHGVAKLVQLILSKEATQISSAPGVGKKSAQRIVLELTSPVEKWMSVEKLTALATDARASQPQAQGMHDDLYSALLNLGYVPNQVKGILQKLFQHSELEKLDFEKCLRWALKEISHRVITTPRKQEA